LRVCICAFDGDMGLDGEVGEESADLGGAHGGGMAPAVKEDEAFGPVGSAAVPAPRACSAWTRRDVALNLDRAIWGVFGDRCEAGSGKPGAAAPGRPVVSRRTR